VNEKKFNILVLTLLLVTVFTQTAQASDMLREANNAYAAGDYNDAIIIYDQAINAAPEAFQPKYNKANTLYRLNGFDNATDLYREVAAESKNMKLVEKAKYNLGNTSYRKGIAQLNTNPQKTIEDLKTAIAYWRQTLDINPQNQKAAKNIEVARLKIKEILDQPKDPNQPQDQNQQQDPNQPQDKNKPKDNNDDNQGPNKPQDPNQEQPPEQPPKQDENQKDMPAPDQTAQEILDKEKEQKKQRENMQRVTGLGVDKDW